MRCCAIERQVPLLRYAASRRDSSRKTTCVGGTATCPCDVLRNGIGIVHTTALHDADQPHRRACCDTLCRVREGGRISDPRIGTKAHDRVVARLQRVVTRQLDPPQAEVAQGIDQLRSLRGRKADKIAVKHALFDTWSVGCCRQGGSKVCNQSGSSVIPRPGNEYDNSPSFSSCNAVLNCAKVVRPWPQHRCRQDTTVLAKIFTNRTRTAPKPAAPTHTG